MAEFFCQCTLLYTAGRKSLFCHFVRGWYNVCIAGNDVKCQLFKRMSIWALLLLPSFVLLTQLCWSSKMNSCWQCTCVFHWLWIIKLFQFQSSKNVYIKTLGISLILNWPKIQLSQLINFDMNFELRYFILSYRLLLQKSDHFRPFSCLFFTCTSHYYFRL